VNRRRKKATAKCPHCGRRLAGKPKPSPDPKRERLKEKLYLLSSGVPSQPGTKKEPRNSAGLAHPDDECD
jgi:DNA-directed RNA polymerase subunit RPC12/RpoP